MRGAKRASKQQKEQYLALHCCSEKFAGLQGLAWQILSWRAHAGKRGLLAAVSDSSNKAQLVCMQG